MARNAPRVTSNVDRLLEELSSSEALGDFGKLIEPLEAHDHEQGADLVSTLRVYLASGANVSEAANRLFLHRNSVAYRLERIGELTGLDYREHRARLALQLGLLNRCNYAQKDAREEPSDAEDERP